MRKSRITLFILLLTSLFLVSCNRDGATPPAISTEIVAGNNDDLLHGVETAQSQQKTVLAEDNIGSDGSGGGVDPTADAIYLLTQAVVTPTLNLVNTATATLQPTNTLVPTISANAPTEYEIKEGEFIYCLARRFDINPQAILDINGYGIDVLLSSGTKIKIPSDAASFGGDRALLAHPTTYTIQANDTLQAIACLYGDVLPENIANANDGIDMSTQLTAGNVINIP